MKSTRKSYNEQYKEIEVLLKTTEKSVSLVQNISTGVYYICKRVAVDQLDSQQQQNLNNQITMLLSTKHANIIKLVDVFREDGFLYRIEEFCEEGDLAHHIKRQTKKGRLFSQQIIEFWMIQLLMALEYAHNKNIVHRDLKASNVYLNNNGYIKLGSFGLSRTLQKSEFAVTYVGTPCSMSPEMVSSKGYNSKTDIWSLGCLLYELCTLKPAFVLQNPFQMANKILKSHPAELPSAFSKELTHVIMKCLEKKPQDRPSAKELLRTKYVLSIMQNFLLKKGVMSEGEQKIPVKRIKTHDKLKLDNKKGIKKGIVLGQPPSPPDPKSDKISRKPLPKQSQPQSISKTPVIQRKGASRQRVNVRVNQSQQKKRTSADTKTRPVAPLKQQKKPLTKVQGQKLKLPAIPKPATGTAAKKSAKKEQQGSRPTSKSSDLDRDFQDVNRSVNSQILVSPASKGSSQQQAHLTTSASQEQSPWMDKSDVDFSLSITHNNNKNKLADQLKLFRKKQEPSSENMNSMQETHANNAYEHYTLQGIPVREDDANQFLPAGSEDSGELIRLTLTTNQLPEMMDLYKTKLQELNYRFGPNMEIIVERTNQFDSNQFQKWKVKPQN